MCGIVTFVDNEAPQVKDSLIQTMMNRIIHRGPDDSGHFVDEGVAMGFRRLSFVDVKSGNQPIFNEYDSMAITFNGEIYNFKPLREELINLGHHFSTHADTEVILHGYEEWGEDVTKRLRGMFAFLIGKSKNSLGPGTTLASSHFTTVKWMGPSLWGQKLSHSLTTQILKNN